MRYWTLLFILVMAACGSPEMVTLDSLVAKQPKVVSIDPEYDATVAKDSQVSVEFSVPIDPASINKYSLLVVKDMQETVPSLISADLEDGKILSMDGDYSFDETKRIASFKPSQYFEAGASYGVIVSTSVYTEEHFPFNQTPGSKATPFISTFTVSADGFIQDISNPSGDGDTSAGTIEVTPEEALPQAIINEVFYDAVGSDTNGVLFVELRGVEGDKIGGYRIVFVNGEDGKITDSITLPSNAVIPQGGLYLVADALDGSQSVSSIAGTSFVSDFDPHNGPDAVQLLSSKGELMDAICYGQVKVTVAENKLALCEGSMGPDAPSGQSVTRDVDGTDSGDNQADLTVNPEPSPGI